jgi:Ion channel
VPKTQETEMLLQLLVGTAASVCNITIHSLLMTAVVRVSRSVGSMDTPHPAVLLTCVMIVTVLVLMGAHACEVVVWATVYLIVGAAPAGSDVAYFAFVNYTTLGYGDITPTEDWKLIGPITAMNGVLLFGWSTAVIFQVLNRTMTNTGGTMDAD